MNRVYVDVKSLIRVALASGELTFADLLELQADSVDTSTNRPVGYACAYGATPNLFVHTDRETGAVQHDRNGKLGLNVRAPRR